MVRNLFIHVTEISMLTGHEIWFIIPVAFIFSEPIIAM
jgi:hypothetical protein